MIARMRTLRGTPRPMPILAAEVRPDGLLVDVGVAVLAALEIDVLVDGLDTGLGVGISSGKYRRKVERVYRALMEWEGLMLLRLLVKMQCWLLQQFVVE